MEHNKDSIYLDPWEPAQSETYVQELYRELGKDHVLFGIPLQIVARRFDCDDVLFKYLHEAKYAQVHLTWRGSTEKDPKWPITMVYDSFEKWRSESMLPDHVSWIG
ncbi:hypothetical protein PCCS19_43370 [Paenibacillus sp. CCS19]|nr:hypothetical protein PCCS19_43370 [Paenibacillus cellulosilyticus]